LGDAGKPAAPAVDQGSGEGSIRKIAPFIRIFNAGAPRGSGRLQVPMMIFRGAIGCFLISGCFRNTDNIVGRAPRHSDHLRAGRDSASGDGPKASKGNQGLPNALGARRRTPTMMECNFLRRAAMFRTILTAGLVAGIMMTPLWAMEDRVTYEGTADDGTTIGFMVTVNADGLPIMTITDKEDRYIVAAQLDFDVSDAYKYPILSECGYANILLDQDFYTDALQAEYLDISLQYHTTIKRENCKYFLDKQKGIQRVGVRIDMEDFPIDQATELLGAVDGLYREDRQPNFNKLLK
jgi:hypothetical protein